jgi:tetratricopeptide (TPR) repeat protein
VKYLALLLLLVGGPGWTLLTRVRDRNAAVAAAAMAYKKGRAERAVAALERALATQRKADPGLLLNLAHAQTRAGRLAPAAATYSQLLAGAPPALGSVARQQLAVLAAQRGEIAQALGLLRQALLLNPRNAGARYDYEALADYLANAS